MRNLKLRHLDNILAIKHAKLYILATKETTSSSADVANSRVRTIHKHFLRIVERDQLLGALRLERGASPLHGHHFGLSSWSCEDRPASKAELLGVGVPGLGSGRGE